MRKPHMLKALLSAALFFWSTVVLGQIPTITEVLTDIQTVLHDPQTVGPDTRLKNLFSQLKAEDAKVQAEFERIEADLQRFPAEVHQRHRDTVANYRQKITPLMVLLSGLIETNDPAYRQPLLTQLSSLVGQTGRTTRSRAQKNQEATPSTIRAPFDTVEALQQVFPPVSATRRGSRDGDKPRLPDLNDLAAHEEVQITPEIQALAQELGPSPVAIYFWVRNHIDFVPSYGAIQGSAQTLTSRRGNAFDTASLLVALLRAAQIPARYVYGTIRVPATTVMNWVGGVETPEAALQLLSQGGIPNRAVVQGGRVDHIELEHLWVEAWVDYMPSRGAKHRQGDSWIPLDASFKTLQLAKGTELETAVPFDSDTLANDWSATAIYEDTWVSSLESSPLQTALTNHQTTLLNWLNNHQSTGTLGGLLGQSTVQTVNYSMLAASLPYQLVARVESRATLPASLRHHYRFALFDSAAAQNQDQAVLDYTANLPQLAGQRISLTFAPASATDEAALQSILPEGPLTFEQLPRRIPGYLVQLQAELRVGDEVVATAGPWTLGTPLFSEFDYQPPTVIEGGTTYVPPHTDSLTAPRLNAERLQTTLLVGEYQVLALNLSDRLTTELQALAVHIASFQATDHRLTRQNIGDLLLASLASYLAANNIYDTWQAKQSGVVAYQAPVLGIARTVLDHELVLGIPQSVSFVGIALDVDRWRVQGVAKNHRSEVTQRFQRQVGRLTSALAPLVLETSFSEAAKSGLSALRALVSALEAEQRLYTLTADTAPAILPTLNLEDSAQATVEQALHHEWQVTVPQDTLTQGSWIGRGVGLTDPLTGQSAYPLLGTGGRAIGLLANDNSQLLGWGTLLISPGPLADLLKPTLLPVQAMTEGLIPLATDPLSVNLTDQLVTLIAGSLIDLQTGPSLPTVLDEHLWTGLLLDHLSLGQLLDPTPPTINVQLASTTLIPGESVTITVTASDNGELATLSVTLNDNPLNLDDNGQTTFTAVEPGRYTLVATATDSSGNLSREEALIQVTDPNDTVPPKLVIHSPTDGSEITAPTPFVATIEETSLVNWKLSVQSVSVPGATLLAQGEQAASNQTIATFDPTMLTNGLYQVIFEAEDANGQTAQIVQTYRVAGDLKVGNFSFTVEDAAIPMMGMPIRVLRTYDTRRKGEALDFGHGWSINYQSTKIEESRVPGEGWTTTRSGYGWRAKVCTEPLGSAPQVTVTLPNGQVEAFQVKAQPTCFEGLGVINSGSTIQLVFQPQPGTLSRLEALDASTQVRLTDDILVDPLDVVIFNPNRYRLTTREGYAYELEQGVGIRKITDPNGNTLTYTNNGMIHSAGKSVHFERDSQGRITKLIDPNQNAISYQYDAAGDLVAVTDTENQTVRYVYNSTHAMTEIKDPLNRKLVRNLYGDDGRLIGQLDAEGNRTNFNHDLEGRQSLVTDRLGRVTQLYYDDRGNVTSSVDPYGNITRSTYDNFGNQLSETNPLNQTTFFKYDNNNLIEETDPEDNVVKFSYNDRGQETSLTDAKGNTFFMDYDEKGNLKEIRLPVPEAKIVNTLENGLIKETRDALEFVTKFTYYPNGDKKTETDPLGNTVTYTYDDNGNQLSESRQRTDSNGNLVTETTYYQYDKQNRLTKITDALNNVTEIEYNDMGQESARIDANQRRTEYAYDVYGNLVETRYPDGTKETRSYDAEGNLLSVTDAANQTTHYEYDKLNRQLKVIHPDKSFTQTEYDAAGRVIAQVDEEKNRTEFQYDKAGRRIQTKNALDQITTFVYDKNGNVSSETDANKRTISYEYDKLDRRIKTFYPDDLVKESRYDLGGRLVAEIDLAGRETQYEYDKLGRLTTVIKFLNGQPVQTTFSYDEVGNRISQTDAKQRTTTWTYDSLGRVKSRTLPLLMTEYFVYAPKTGNLISHTDFNEKTTTFSYDPKNDRLLSTTYADERVESFTYNEIGNRKTMTDSSGTTTYHYDERQHLIKEVKPNQAVLEYDYDKLGNRKSLKFTPPGGSTVEVQYQYDELSRLQKVIAPDGETTYTYDAVGNRRQVSYANGTYTQYGYDKLNRLTSLETHKPDNSLLASYQYTLAPTGHRTQIVEHTGRVVDYTYDDLYRLTEEKVTQNDYVTGFSYQYDKVGNRTYETQFNGPTQVQTQYTYDDNDRLTKQGGVEYEYDKNGNTTRIAEEGNAVLYRYDSNDRLIKVTTEENGQVTSTVTYAYDADGNRIQTNADGEVTQYVVDSNDSLAQVIAELDANNQVNVAYLHGDDLISQYRGNEVNYYHYDGLGSTRTLTNPNSEVTDSYTYEAFGELQEQTGNTENNYLFTGEQLDPNTGNYYLRNRFYNPGSGRFLSMDSFGGIPKTPVTLHKYLYANGNPVNMVDPTGLFSLGSFSVGNTVRSILTTMNRVDKVLNILDVVTDPMGAVTDKLSNKAMGALVILGKLSKSTQKVFLRLVSRCRSKKKKKNSFTASTLVHTERGLVPIEEVRIGDFVLSYDEQTGQEQSNEVIHLVQGQQEYDLITLTLDSGETIETTADHPFYIKDKGFYPANTLKVGQALQLRNGTVVVIQEITTETRLETVYNLTVTNTHNYFIGIDGVLVQNCKPEVALIQAHTKILDLAQDELRSEGKLEKLEQAHASMADSFHACYASAVHTGLRSQFYGIPRAILDFPDAGHAVLGIGTNFDNMKIIDVSRPGNFRKGLNTGINDNCALSTYRKHRSDLKVVKVIIGIEKLNTLIGDVRNVAGIR